MMSQSIIGPMRSVLPMGKCEFRSGMIKRGKRAILGARCIPAVQLLGRYVFAQRLILFQQSDNCVNCFTRGGVGAWEDCSEVVLQKLAEIAAVCRFNAHKNR